MIDTIKFQYPQPLPLREPSRATKERAKASEDWRAFYEYIKANGTARHGLVLVHKRTGVRIYCHGDTVVALEASLPRLLFGDNASLITAQSEIDEAHRRMDLLLSEWAMNNQRVYEFTRVDVVLNFRIPEYPASAFIQNLSAMRHPHCRTRQREWDYDGRINACYHTGGDMTIKAYDKELEVQVRSRVREENRHLGEIIRLEIQLSGSTLQRALGGGEGSYPRSLVFHRCYQAYRSLLHEFGPIAPQLVGTRKVRQFLLDLLARAHQENWLMEDGRPVIDHLRGCSDGPTTIRKYGRIIAGRNLATMNLTWEGLLPEQWPPPHLALSLNQQFGASVTRQRRRAQGNSDTASHGG